MKKRMLSMALALYLVLSLLPTVALAANISGSISADTTWSNGDTISGAVNITGGTVGAPVIITVTGTVTVNALITVESGHVKITGTNSGMLKKGNENSANMVLEVKDGSTVTLENVIIDGANRSTSLETVHITAGSTLNLGAGAIIQNCERSGQGAAINMDGIGSRLNMADGSSIQNNTSTSTGGVVWIYQGIFTMTGGSITGNKGYGSSGGVYVGGSMEIGGSAVIKDNTLADGVTARNVSLGSNTLTVSGELTAPDGSIGVTRGTGVFAKGKTSAPGYTIVEADKAKFFADDGVSPIALQGGELSFTENYDVFVGATQVTKSNSSDVLNDGTVSYTPAQGGNPQKLTLKGATISGSNDGASRGGAISARGDLILELAENTVNTVTNNLVSESGSWQAGVFVADGNLTIQSSGNGSGKLTATGGKSTSASFGIGVELNKLTINSGTIIANGLDCIGGSSGIYANMGVTITGGTVTTTGAEAYGATMSRGIEITNGNGDISISGGTVIAKSTDTTEGEGIAMTKAPVLSSDRAVTVASTAADGSSPTPYNETDIGTYKYLEIGEKVPVPPPYTGPSYYYYTLKATAAAGGAISPTGNVSVRERLNQTFKITPDKGFEIDDVLVDGKSVGAVSAYTFEKVVKGHTIEAKFVKIWDNPFTDVAKDDAYYRAVQYVSESGLMIGTAADCFAPKGEISRAMIVTILHRLAGTPAASVPAAFDDLGSDTWYTAALSWGAEAQVINGYGNGKFGPADAITREQLVTMLWRLAKSPVPTDDTGLSQYGDAGEISPWARPALAWAHQQGLLDCFGPHLLPQTPATRGETAIILEKMNRIS